MTLDQIVIELKSTLVEIQTMSGAPPESEITEDTVPLDSLKDFDSMRIMETVTILSVKLGIDIPGSGIDVFCSCERNFTVSEIATVLSICELTKPATNV